MRTKEILKRKFGAEAPQIENEITERINETVTFGGNYEDVEDILMDYGLEMDFILDFI